MKLSKPSMNEMTAKSLGDIAEIFLEDKLVPEYKIQRFKIDFFSQKYKIAYEYDGPEHYCEVNHIERDMRKDVVCEEAGIHLVRWPYYFQFTKDVARWIFREKYSDIKYDKSIKLVYNVDQENNILAPGLHKSKNTPANFVERGIKRFLFELDQAPESLKSQVIYSFQLYLKRLGKGREWLLFPENDARFIDMMTYKPNEAHLNYLYPAAIASKNELK
jgi:hypothetical protein